MRTKEISYAGYLLKPISPDSLATTLDTVLYKYNLEKRAELAEERYRKLEKSCVILKYFTEHGAAYEWSGNTEKGITIEGLDEPLNSILAAAILPLLQTEAERVSAVLCPEGTDGSRYSIFTVRDSETGLFTGLVIPVSGDSV